ncbi:hypothetical protein FIV42_24760 [Persicimonas caeni]|uniref:Uncharacterized protein n=1 Tax=Persicimonas caeni TaxID=2292766 RepID=A0A4Y6Q3D6_PERCE|nr:hypothetical protein FIV42_24760 [Persicimonas caeni]QED36182.1 hypothetical protein FRD00_24755 [Persicimonas caeni]
MSTGETSYRPQQSDSRRKTSIGHQASRLPSDFFVWAALASVAGSAYLRAVGEGEKSLFVGQWAPTFLAFGVYNKIIRRLDLGR